MILNTRNLTWSAVLAAAMLMSVPAGVFAAESASEKEQKLIAVLKSDAPAGEKAITCKRLAIYGSKEAVPALAPLLADKDLASWARIALEAIPDPSAEEAMREAVGKVQGKLLVGVINSLGVKRDSKAVSALIGKLKDADLEVAGAAGEALGRIGGSEAAKALEQALNRSAGEFNRETLAMHSAIAYGAILCAEKYMAEGKAAEAVRLFEQVRQANVPKQNRLEATRGAILARGTEGLPLLMEQLRSDDKGMLAIGLSTARELKGRQVTEALIAELAKAQPDRQVMILLAVADRGDATVLPKLMEIGQSGSKQLRTSAIGMIDRFGDVTCVPVLLKAAADDDADLSKTAKASLSRLGGKEVDADLLGRFGQSSGRDRQVLIELAKQRRIEAAMPAIVQSCADKDADVRRAALETVGLMGSDSQVAELIRLLPNTQAGRERDEMETALVAICGRSGARALPAVMPLAKNQDTGLRAVGLHLLSSIGGPEALGIIQAAVNDKDAAVQDEAVKMLSTWPNKWPEDTAVAEPLLALAKSSGKTSHQLQGLRGYLQFVEEDKKIKSEDKIAQIKDLLPLIKRTEEKRLTISVLSGIPSAAGLDILTTFANDNTVSEEASMAIVKVATGKNQTTATKEMRRKALQVVVEKAKNEGTKKKAEEALSKIN